MKGGEGGRALQVRTHETHTEGGCVPTALRVAINAAQVEPAQLDGRQPRSKSKVLESQAERRENICPPRLTTRFGVSAGQGSGQTNRHSRFCTCLTFRREGQRLNSSRKSCIYQEAERWHPPSTDVPSPIAPQTSLRQHQI